MAVTAELARTRPAPGRGMVFSKRGGFLRPADSPWPCKLLLPGRSQGAAAGRTCGSKRAPAVALCRISARNQPVVRGNHGALCASMGQQDWLTVRHGGRVGTLRARNEHTSVRRLSRWQWDCFCVGYWEALYNRTIPIVLRNPALRDFGDHCQSSLSKIFREITLEFLKASSRASREPSGTGKDVHTVAHKQLGGARSGLWRAAFALAVPNFFAAFSARAGQPLRADFSLRRSANRRRRVHRHEDHRQRSPDGLGDFVLRVPFFEALRDAGP